MGRSVARARVAAAGHAAVVGCWTRRRHRLPYRDCAKQRAAGAAARGCRRLRPLT